MENSDNPERVILKIVNIKEKAVLIIFALFALYGFFPFGIENSVIIGILRLVIFAFFLVFILFRSSREHELEKDEKPPGEKEPEKDLEIIQKFADERFLEKKIDAKKEFETYINKILRIIQDSFIAHSVVMCFYEQERNEVILRAHVSKSDSINREIALSPDEGFIEVLFKGEKTVIFHDNEAADYEEKIYTSKEEISSMICSPIFVSEEIIGCLILDSKVDKAFSEDDKIMMESYSEMISATILNYNNIYEYENTIDLFSGFYEISQKLNSNLSFDEILNILIDILRRIFTYDRISVSLRENNGKEAVIKRVVGQTDEFEENYKFLIEEGLNGWVIRKNKTILVADLEKGDYFIPRYTIKEKSNHHLRSFVGAPLNYRNSCLGVVAVESKKPNVYTDRHERLLSLLSNNIGVSLDRSMLYSELQNLATTDGLTGINNYRYFRQRLGEEIERAKRYTLKFSLLMLDIDSFKAFNDQYGHLVGDNILKNIAIVIRNSIRNIDFLARYGGEEFSVILVETGMNRACQTAERIRQNIESSKIEYNGASYSVSISIGISEYSNEVSSEDELIAQADKALYQAKAEGRNKVIYYNKE